MTIPTFIDLQGFIDGKKFVMKEVAVRKGAILFHYIFTCTIELLDKVRKVLRFLAKCLSHGLQ